MSRILDVVAKSIVGCGLAFATFVPCSSARAKDAETVLHSFCSRSDCRDGETPEGGLVMDGAGNLYGTTSNGGANWAGNVFRINPDGTYKVLNSFCSERNCTDGSSPYGSLIIDGSGRLYGTTLMGGTANCNGDAGCGGTVFSIDAKTGTEAVLYDFCSASNCSDGENPAAGVIMDSSGNLYGTTQYGGAYGNGVIFKLTTRGKEKVLYSFGESNNDGFNPATALVLDGAGNLYGTTQFGGANGLGNVFEVTPRGTFKLLYSFCNQANCSDGSIVEAAVIIDGSGNLYGTTTYGGVNDYGTVFKLSASGTETVLYDLCSRHHCSDGARPVGGLTMDSAGNLYGTAIDGTGRHCYTGGPYICGTAFKLAGNGVETTLYSFCSRRNCADGGNPTTSLIMDNSGNLYGTTLQGGKGHCLNGCGAVFELAVARENSR